MGRIPKVDKERALEVQRHSLDGSEVVEDHAEQVMMQQAYSGHNAASRPTGSIHMGGAVTLAIVDDVPSRPYRPAASLLGTQSLLSPVHSSTYSHPCSPVLHQQPTQPYPVHSIAGPSHFVPQLSTRQAANHHNSTHIIIKQEVVDNAPNSYTNTPPYRQAVMMDQLNRQATKVDEKHANTSSDSGLSDVASQCTSPALTLQSDSNVSCSSSSLITDNHSRPISSPNTGCQPNSRAMYSPGVIKTLVNQVVEKGLIHGLQSSIHSALQTVSADTVDTTEEDRVDVMQLIKHIHSKTIQTSESEKLPETVDHSGSDVTVRKRPRLLLEEPAQGINMNITKSKTEGMERFLVDSVEHMSTQQCASVQQLEEIQACLGQMATPVDAPSLPAQIAQQHLNTATIHLNELKQYFSEHRRNSVGTNDFAAGPKHVVAKRTSSKQETILDEVMNATVSADGQPDSYIEESQAMIDSTLKRLQVCDEKHMACIHKQYEQMLALLSGKQKVTGWGSGRGVDISQKRRNYNCVQMNWLIVKTTC